ncbi:MAG TPA: glycosyltransferase [Pirellulales bacterium]|nr:glycosyltransferase [Pirellulales bacterium]
MPRLAIVIPAVGTAESLETTLLAVLENRPHDCEVIAVTNFDYADPYKLGDEVRFLPARTGADLVACAGAAIAIVRSPIIHVLAAGCEVGDRWVEPALEQFVDLSVGAVAPLVLHADRRDQVLAAGIDYRVGGARRVRVKKLAQVTAAGSTAVFGVCGQAAFFRRSALEAVGGWTAAVGPELADVELAWALSRAGYRTLLEPAARVYAQQLPATRLSAFRQGLYGERLFWRNARQVGWLKALAAHAWVVGWDTMAHLTHPSVLLRLAGRACAVADFGHYRRHQAEVLPVAESDSDRSPASEHLRIDGDHSSRPAVSGERVPRRMRTA